MLFARTLTTDTKCDSVFKVLKNYFMVKAILSSNKISLATDGEPGMFGSYCGFLSHSK